MKRSLRLDRRYALGDYKYITLFDDIEEIPEELLAEPEVVSKLRLMQLLSTEITYRKYLNLITKYPHTMNPEEAVLALEKMHMEELKGLKDILPELSRKTNGKIENID